MARSGYTWDSGVQLMFEAYPSAVEQLAWNDIFTLFSNFGNGGGDDDGGDNDELQGIYSILRSAPSLMDN
jgi:hypothetical protein